MVVERVIAGTIWVNIFMKSNLPEASDFLDGKEIAVALSMGLAANTVGGWGCHEIPTNRVNGYQVKPRNQWSVKGSKQRI